MELQLKAPTLALKQGEIVTLDDAQGVPIAASTGTRRIRHQWLRCVYVQAKRKKHPVTTKITGQADCRARTCAAGSSRRNDRASKNVHTAHASTHAPNQIAPGCRRCCQKYHASHPPPPVAAKSTYGIA